ncbi:MAG: hypothetical protein E6J90_47480 [Deltaproteobacteria bacterium]|nr:MAG: hypothetical protein E6J90_47480 [Deltaproteobacteria bacterium]TMQ11664.1 MAG: hypothetical protein E6J91_22255 [Deltaproteobacteria bacterium]
MAEETKDVLTAVVEILENDEPAPKASPIKALTRKVKATPPQYVTRAIEELQKHEAHAQKMIAYAEQNLKAVDALVEKKDDQVAGRVFRANIYTALLGVAAIVAGVDHNTAWGVASGVFAIYLRGEGGARSYFWHRLKKKIRSLTSRAMKQHREWTEHKQFIIVERTKLEQRRDQP